MPALQDIFVCFVLLWSSANAVCSNDDMGRMSRCFDPLVKLWLRSSIEEPQMKRLSFPVFNLPRDSLLQFCQTYRQSVSDCYDRSLHHRCRHMRTTDLFTRMFGFVCGIHSWMFFQHLSCIQESLRKVNSCEQLITLGYNQQADHSDTCKRLQPWYHCTVATVKSTCGMDATNVLTGVVENSGCATDKTVCREGNQTEINDCLSDLQVKWQIIRKGNPESTGIVLPALLYKSAELQFICAAYEELGICVDKIQVESSKRSCDDLSGVKYVDRQLGYVCGENAEVYRSHSNCIAKLLLRNSICLSFITGDQQESNLAEAVCADVRTFHDCIAQDLSTNCSTEALLVFEETVENFGCDIREADRALSPSGCNLPMDTGPCEKVKVRWYYNQTSQECEPFIYGGCKGNANNFISPHECDQVCSRQRQRYSPSDRVRPDPSIPQSGVDRSIPESVGGQIHLPMAARLKGGMNCPPVLHCPKPDCSASKLHPTSCERCFCFRTPPEPPSSFAVSPPLKVGINCPPVVDCVLNCVPILMRDGCPSCYCYGGQDYNTEEPLLTRSLRHTANV